MLNCDGMVLGMYNTDHVRIALVSILRGNSLLRMDKLSEAQQTLTTAQKNLIKTFGVRFLIFYCDKQEDF